MTNTKHYTDDRKHREYIIRFVIGTGKPVAEFYVNEEGKKDQYHVITDTGIVEIYNATNGKLITKLIARVAQLDRYWKYTRTYTNTNRYHGADLKALKALAQKHTQLGYNNI